MQAPVTVELIGDNLFRAQTTLGISFSAEGTTSLALSFAAMFSLFIAVIGVNSVVEFGGQLFAAVAAIFGLGVVGAWKMAAWAERNEVGSEAFEQAGK